MRCRYTPLLGPCFTSGLVRPTTWSHRCATLNVYPLSLRNYLRRHDLMAVMNTSEIQMITIVCGSNSIYIYIASTSLSWVANRSCCSLSAASLASFILPLAVAKNDASSAHSSRVSRIVLPLDTSTVNECSLTS